MEPWPWISSLLLVLLALILLLLLWGRVPGGLPPGPQPLPLLGNLLQLRGQPLLRSLLRLRERYGPVFTVHLGPRPVVMLCGYTAVKEALVDQADDFGARAEMPMTQRTSKGCGIAFSNGETWKQLRRFALSALRDLGMGRRSIEERIQEELGHLLGELRQTGGAPTDPTFLLHRSVANVICSVVFGERFDYSDSELQELLDLMQENARRLDDIWVQLYALFPWLLGPLPGPHNRLFENFDEQKRYVARVVRKHEDTLEPAAPRDYIDTFLIRMQQEEGDPSTQFHRENLLVSALDLFFAGSETTSSTLRYGLLLLLKYPHVAERVQEEIQAVVGPSRLPCGEDRQRMPYTDATIHEIQRFIDIVPLGVPRMITQDARFRGYVMPKGTTVFPLLNSVLHDPAWFPDPETFDPAHFLDDKGGFRRNAAFVPFSAGKRACPGEGLARTELFLFFTSVLQCFAIASPVGAKELDIMPEHSGFGKAPPRYQVCFTPRW